MMTNAVCFEPCAHTKCCMFAFVFCRKPELLKGVYEMGFNAPSKIQETALPVLLCDPYVLTSCMP